MFASLPAWAQAPTQLQQLDLQLQQLYNAMADARGSSPALGADAAGHTLVADVDALVMTPDTAARVQALRKQAAQSSTGSGDAASAVTAVYEATALVDHENRQLQLLQQYWKLAPALRYLRELWQRQMTLAPTALAALGPDKVGTIVAASIRKIATLEQAAWASRTQVPADVTKAPLLGAEGDLIAAYNSERQTIPALIAANPPRVDAEVATTPRVTACQPPAASAEERAKTEPVKTVSMGDPAAFYPEAEQDRLVEGRVIVTLRIAANGCMTYAGVNTSSGDPALDAAALQLAETGVFLPALRDGTPIEGYKNLAIRFLFNR